MSAGKRANRLNANVSGEDKEARGDQLLGATFGALRAEARTCEEPHDDEPRQRLDEAVRSEPNQGDGARRDPSDKRDGELDEVVTDSAPRE